MKSVSEAPTSGAKQRAADARCAAMVHHARRQIRAEGLQRFSTNEVLRLSGGSKATLAKYFGGRMGLVAAAIAEEAREATATLAITYGDAGDRPLGESLIDLLSGILRFYLTPGSLSLYRTVIAAADQDPGMAMAFYQQGHSLVRDAVADFIASRRSDLAPAVDARDAADCLLHAIRAGVYEKALLNLIPLPVPDAEIRGQVAQTVALMLPGLHAIA